LALSTLSQPFISSRYVFVSSGWLREIHEISPRQKGERWRTDVLFNLDSVPPISNAVCVVAKRGRFGQTLPGIDSHSTGCSGSIMNLQRYGTGFVSGHQGMDEVASGSIRGRINVLVIVAGIAGRFLPGRSMASMLLFGPRIPRQETVRYASALPCRCVDAKLHAGRGSLVGNGPDKPRQSRL
jgi:hypothetical protein